MDKSSSGLLSTEGYCGQNSEKMIDVFRLKKNSKTAIISGRSSAIDHLGIDPEMLASIRFCCSSSNDDHFFGEMTATEALQGPRGGLLVWWREAYCSLMVRINLPY